MVERIAGYERSKRYCDGILETLRQKLTEEIGHDPSVLIGVNGSFARREGSSQSDLDWFVICREESGRETLKTKLPKIRECLLAVVKKAPAAEGIFKVVESVDRMLVDVGGLKDDTAKLSRRMLYLLEGNWLYNKEFFDEIMRKILEKYIRQTISDHQLALFLLNDIIRYYRTICVDFEQKTAEDGKPWGTRNIKLVFSRKLIYFSGVLAVAETYRCTAKEKVEKLLALLALSPVERIIDICGSKALHALALYDFFLEEFSKETVRDECDATTEANRHDQPTFRLLKNRGHEFSGRLRSLLNETYDPGHPIHHALLF